MDTDLQTSLNQQLAAAIRSPEKTVQDVRALLDAGADVDYVEFSESGQNWTPMTELAAIYHRADVIRLFGARGANFEATDESGNTALLKAAQCSKPETMWALFEQGARMDAINHAGDGVVHCAAQNRDLRGFDLVLSLGIAYRQASSDHDSPLDYARTNGQVSEAESVIRNVRPWPRIREEMGIPTTRRSLLAKNEDGFCMLDHPATWHQYGDVVLQHMGVDGLLQETDMADRPWMARAIECGQFDRLQDALAAEGRTMADVSLWVNPNGKSTPMLDAMGRSQMLSRLFENEIGDALSVQGLRQIYQAIPKEQQVQVLNIHQLIANKSRWEKLALKEAATGYAHR